MPPAPGPVKPARSKPCDRLLDDRQIDDGGEHPNKDREPPDGVVGAGALEHDAAEQDAEEAADLVAEEGKADEHGQPAGPNITATSALVGGTVESHSKPMAAPKTSEVTGVTETR